MHTSLGVFPQQETLCTRILYELIYSFHMPLFILVTGAVFGICRQKGKYDTFKKLFINKFNRVYIPYVLFGFLVLAPCLYALDLVNYSFKNYCISDILFGGGNIRHLWYLVTIFELYFLTYSFEGAVINKVNPYILLGVLFVVGTFAQHFLGYCYFQINNVITYLPYFVWGFLLGERRLTFSYPIIGIAICLPAAVALSVFSHNLDSIFIPFIKYLTASLFLYVALGLSDRFFAQANSKFCKLLKRDGMGIYLYHVIILYTAYYYNLFNQLGIFFQIVMNTVLAIVLSMIFTKLTRKIHLQKLIGE